MKNNHLLLPLSILFFSILLSACDWVDSVGTDSVDSVDSANPLDPANPANPVDPVDPSTIPEPTTNTSTITVFLDDIALGDSVAINESTIATITASRSGSLDDEQTFTWSANPVEEGSLDVCLAQQDFTVEQSVDTLTQACPFDENCEIAFEPGNVESDSAQFTLRIPTLFASIGLTYQLDVEDGNGVITSNEYSFCLIAVNDAPEANADVFVVADGDVLNVLAGEGNINLLSNDRDDEHISNSDLSVVPESSGRPQDAAFFELRDDGSFIYQPDFTGIQQDRLDGFEYQLTDGVSQSTAQVTIQVVAGNQAPQLLSSLPFVLATEGDTVSVDVSNNFSDPDSNIITFSLSESTPLAPGSGLEFSSEGVLAGVPTEADVGNFALTVIASDGLLTTGALLSLEIEAAPLNDANSAPLFVRGSVFDQTVEFGESITNVRPGFIDTDDDELTYSLSGTRSLPIGVGVNMSNGVVSGTPLEAGTFNGLRVRATDLSGATAVSTAFSIIVEDF